jgi:hypothetical protein
MTNPIKKNEGQIQVNLPKDKRLEAIMDIASSNEQIAIALRNAAESNIQLAKALQVSPQIAITGCTIISNGQFDYGISVKDESDYDEYQEEYCNEEYDNEDEDIYPSDEEVGEEQHEEETKTEKED